MQKRIKVLHILPSLTRGGAEKICFDILTNLDRKIFLPQLILFKDNGEGLKWKKDLKNKDISIISLIKRYKIDFLNFWQLYKAILRIKPDIIHTHLGADVYGRLAGYLANIKVIVSTEHNINKTEKKIISWLKKITNSKTAKIFAVSQAVKIDALNRYQLKADKLVVIYNGIDINYFKSQIKTKIKPEDKKIIIGAMGRLSPQKGFAVLIEAVKKIKSKNFEIQIAGQGELEIQLKKQISHLGLASKVKLVGKVETRDFLDKIDIFVFPSLWEGLGLAALEAGAMNKPIIASDTGGIKEIITTESGFLFKPGDENDLALKINYVISNLNKEEINEKIIKAREIISKRFSLDKMIFDYSVWYKKLYYNR